MLGADLRTARRTLSLSRTALATVIAVTLFTVSGCGLLGGSQDDASDGPLEKPVINVGSMPIVDTAAFQYAIDKGYFQQAGLTVNKQDVQGGSAGVPLVNNGQLDITFGNYVSFFQAQAAGQANLKLVADAYQCAQGMFLLLGMPSATAVAKPEDLRHKTVAVNTRNNIAELTTMATLKTHGVLPQDVKVAEMPFPAMPGALRRGDISAAMVTEPYISEAEMTGATTIADTCAGPTESMPIAGFATTSKFAQENPKTLAAFRRVMERAQAEVNNDRNKVEEEVPRYAHVDQKTAALVRLGTYPSSLEAGRLSRVIELMQANGSMPPSAAVDVQSMIFQPPRASGS